MRACTHRVSVAHSGPGGACEHAPYSGSATVLLISSMERSAVTL
jgi:hypothetical protein